MSDRELRLKILLDGMDKASNPIRAIGKEASIAAKGISEARGALKQLERTQADIQGFRTLKRDLQETERTLEKARGRTAALAREMGRTEQPSRAMARDFERAKREADQLGATFERQHRALQLSRDRLRQAGISTRALATDEKRLRQEIKASTAELDRRSASYREMKESAPARLAEARATARAEAVLESERVRRADRWNNSARYGAGVVGTAVGVAASATGVNAVVEAAQYEKSLTSIGQKADLTRAQAQRLGETLRALAPQVARMPGQMADSADTLAGIGLLSRFDGIKDPEARFRAIENATRSIMIASGKAATAYEADQDDMVRSTASAVQNLGISADKAQRILDIMAAGDNAGAFGLKAMGAELPALTGAWGALGQTGEKALGQLVAGLEIVKTNAGDEAEAANNLRNLILKLNSRELANNFKNFGVDLPSALKKAKAEGRDLLEVIVELTNKATKGDNDKIGQIFTDQQAQMAIIALNGKMKEYITLRGQVMQSDGLLDRQFAERMQDQATRWDKLKSSWTAFEVEVGNSMRPISDRIVDGATSTLEKITANIRAQGFWNTLGNIVNGPGLMPAEAMNKAYLDARLAQDQGLKDQKAAAQRSLNEAGRYSAEMQQKMRGGSEGYSSIGRNMILGIQAGMASQMPFAMTAMAVLAARFKAAFTSPLKIRSPSRVFMGYGENITEGLARGILASGRTPVAAAGQLSKGVMARGRPAGSPQSLARSIPSNINITVQQQPGEDGEALARRVADLIEARQRNAGRGAYRDD